MEEQQTTVPVTNPPASQPGVFGTKIPSSVTFAVAILLFFMPFVDITCNSMTLQTVSGIQLATGFKMKAADPGSSFMGNMDTRDNDNTKKSNRESPNTFALLALGLGIFGFILSLQSLKAGGVGGIVTGALSAASLLGLLIDIQSKIKAKIPDTDAQVKVSVDVTAWFYITLITFLAAAYFSYKRMKANLK